MYTMYSAGDDPNAKPTARAITERLVKMRQLAKSNGAGHFSIGKVGSAPSTPRKSSSAKSTTPASGKRKHGPTADNGMLKPDPEAVNIDSDDDGTENKDSLKAAAKNEHAKKEFKSESPATAFGETDILIDNIITPSKRVCTPRTYQFSQSEGESSVDSASDPEFLPEGLEASEEDEKIREMKGSEMLGKSEMDAWMPRWNMRQPVLPEGACSPLFLFCLAATAFLIRLCVMIFTTEIRNDGHVLESWA